MDDFSKFIAFVGALALLVFCIVKIVASNSGGTYFIDSNKVTCREVYLNSCGLSLYKCDNGKEYQCLINTTRIK